MALGKACRDWLTASRSAASRARVTASRAVLRGEPADIAFGAICDVLDCREGVRTSRSPRRRSRAHRSPVRFSGSVGSGGGNHGGVHHPVVRAVYLGASGGRLVAKGAAKSGLMGAEVGAALTYGLAMLRRRALVCTARCSGHEPWMGLGETGIPSAAERS